MALAVVGACAKPPPPRPPPPPPDADASPPQAQALPLAAAHPDSLHRAERDLDDWYRLEIPDDGTLTVTLTAADAGLPHLFVAVTDDKGLSTTQPTRAGGRPQVVTKEKVRKGQRLVWIGTDPEASGAIPYEIRADFVPNKRPPPPPKRPEPPPPPRKAEPRPAPPPPPPQVETFTSSVVEADRAQGSSQFVTIRGGEKAGLRPGLRGRLIDGGRTIGRFTIVEVYGAGSRVRVDGGMAGAVTSQTVVEVDVPR